MDQRIMLETDPSTEKIGFRFGLASVHTSRTMMLKELALLMDHLGPDARQEDYRDAIVQENVLAKPTRSTRERTAERLKELYALDPACPPFRAFRVFWAADSRSRPMLTLLLACARDPLLRQTTPFVLETVKGGQVNIAEVSKQLTAFFPGRFRESTVLATAQRLASSWTQSGILSGKTAKRRVSPEVTPVVVAFAVLLGYVCGVRGAMLLESEWVRLLDRSRNEIGTLVAESSKQGWLTYKAAGSVVEISFPNSMSVRTGHDNNGQN